MIKFNEIIKDKEYRQRVIKYFRLPIRLSVSEEKFLSDLEFIKLTEPSFYNTIIEYTEHDFNKVAKEQGTSTPDFTMEDILEPLLDKIKSTEGWQKFEEKECPDVLGDYEGVTNIHQFYKKENDGKKFVSIDLKAANWQSLQKITGMTDSYEDLIVQYTDNLIPPISKTFRTKVTGLLNAREIMMYNKKLLHDNKESILQSLAEVSVDLVGLEPFAFYADEFLIEIDDEALEELNKSDLPAIEEHIANRVGIEVHVRPFQLRWLNINKACLKIYKEDVEFINISRDILLLINKIMSEVEIHDIDFEGIPLKDMDKEEYVLMLRSRLTSKLKRQKELT